MTRRTAHKILLATGLVVVALAINDVRMDWWNRSDMLWGGLLVMALGVHGIWTVSK